MATSPSSSLLPVRVVVDLPGRDRIEARGEGPETQIRVLGCVALQEKVKALVVLNPDPAKWELPEGRDHNDLLIKEFILRARGEWQFPYGEAELCHCRSVPTEVVDQAIVAGAHTCVNVSSRTSASTACGTCRPDVQKIIDYRLKTGA